MKQYEYETNGVCAKKIRFTVDDENKLHDVSFEGGCNGNLKAISRLVEGKDASEIAKLLSGNFCGNRSTSCADQLAKAITSR